MHINKTGGTSIETALGECMPKAFDPEKHMDSKSMINLYGKEIWKKYFTFSIVRNPWDRIISMYHSKYYALQGVGKYAGRSLKYFLNNL